MNKLEYLKRLTKSDDEFLLQYSLDRVEELILNYTNNKKLPNEVDMTHIEMSLLHFKFNNNLLNNPQVEDSSNKHNVGKIHEGDTTVEFAKVSDMESSMDKAQAKRMFEDKLLHDFRIPLHRIRKMRW